MMRGGRLNLTRSSYFELRKTIRCLSLINSRQAERNRESLADRKILMGGIVLSKKETLLTDTATDQSEVVAVWLTLYDGSGDFEVVIDLSKLDKEMRRITCLIKVGRLIFISGVLESVKNARGCYVSAQAVYSKEEIEFYKKIYSEQYEAQSKDLNQIKRLDVSESEKHQLEFVRSAMVAIRCFVSKKERRSYTDYQSIENAAWEIYEESQDRRAADLVLKYYLRGRVEMVRRNGQTLNSESWKSHFFKMHSNLEGVVAWPSN